MKCSYCGKIIPDDADVCRYCGNIVLVGEAKSQGFSYSGTAYANGTGQKYSSGQQYCGASSSASGARPQNFGNSAGANRAGSNLNPNFKQGYQQTNTYGRAQSSTQSQRSGAYGASNFGNYSTHSGAANATGQKNYSAQQTSQRVAQKTAEAAAKEASERKAAKMKADEAAAKQSAKIKATRDKSEAVAAKLAAQRRVELEKADIKKAKEAMMKRIADEKVAGKAAAKEAKKVAYAAKDAAKNAFKEAKRAAAAQRTAVAKAETGLYTAEISCTVLAFAFCLIGFAFQIFEMRGEFAGLVELVLGMQSTVLYIVLNNLCGIIFAVCATVQLTATVLSCVTTAKKVKSCLFLTAPMFIAYAVIMLLQFIKYMI